MQIVKYVDTIPLKDKIYRLSWISFSWIFFKPFGLPIFNRYRIFILKLFGAKLHWTCKVYSSAYIPSPKNLTMDEESTIGPQVKLHFGKTFIGKKVTVSQRAYLCSATHDTTSLNTPLIIGEIVIKDYAWIAAEAFIMSGVIIEEGAIIGARAAVFKRVGPWDIVGGNPARFIKKRIITN